MNSLTANMALRLWMLFLLLAYSVQSVAGFGWNQDLSGVQSHSVSECHTMTSQEASIESMAFETQASPAQPSSECCTSDCPMVSCHNVSLFVSHLTELRLAKVMLFNFGFKPLKPFNMSSSPYRPPILG